MAQSSYYRFPSYEDEHDDDGTLGRQRGGSGALDDQDSMFPSHSYSAMDIDDTGASDGYNSGMWNKVFTYVVFGGEMADGYPETYLPSAYNTLERPRNTLGRTIERPPNTLHRTIHPDDENMNNNSDTAPIYGVHVEDVVPEEEEEEIQRKNRFAKRPIFCLLVVISMSIGLLLSLYWNYKEEGEFLQTKPFNYMIGPSIQTLIHLGATHTPCMLETSYFNPPACPPDEITAYPPKLHNVNGTTYACGDLVKYCGISSFEEPNQWWRLFTSLFFNPGIIPVVVNGIVTYKFGLIIERVVGPIRFFLIYISCSVFGYALAGIFTPMHPVTGSTPAMLGIMAALLLDVTNNWKILYSPKLQLFTLLFFLLLLLGLGFTPFLNNFWYHILLLFP